MTAEQWRTGRRDAGLTQIAAARSLHITQPYLSQLETGLRVPSSRLVRKATRLYRLPATALPLRESLRPPSDGPGELQNKLAALGYPGFEHVRAGLPGNPAEVVLSALVKNDLDTRLVEALPWVVGTYPDLQWDWLRDRAKLQNIQNRLGYVVHLAKEWAADLPKGRSAVRVLSSWEDQLEAARLASEGTLCRDSMPERERTWLRANRPAAAAHWNLLTSLTSRQLPYADN
jgi:transcriptional regulator with XRE-family HTH domain